MPLPLLTKQPTLLLTLLTQLQKLLAKLLTLLAKLLLKQALLQKLLAKKLKLLLNNRHSDILKKGRGAMALRPFFMGETQSA